MNECPLTAESVAAAVLAIHRNEHGNCAECTSELLVSWPCTTARAVLDAADKDALLLALGLAAGDQSNRGD